MELTSTEHKPQNATLSSKFIQAKDIMWISYINPQLRMCTRTLMYAYATNSKMSLGDIQIINTGVVVPGRRGHIHWQWSKRKATHELEPSSPPLLLLNNIVNTPVVPCTYHTHSYILYFLKEAPTKRRMTANKTTQCNHTCSCTQTSISSLHLLTDYEPKPPCNCNLQ